MPAPRPSPAAPRFAAFPAAAAPRAPLLPLQGLTLLLVEDSRYASDALRLMCQRSGARLRRAGSIAAARAHLRAYRPDLAIVDLGLPDGRGEGLIRSLARAGHFPVLGTSGDPDGRRHALAAGADGFLDKPVPGLAAFQSAVLALIPGAAPAAAGGAVTPDPLALADDLVRAAAVLEAGPGPAERAWARGFVAGLARLTDDATLAAASRRLDGGGMAPASVAALLRDRAARAAAFASGAVPRGA